MQIAEVSSRRSTCFRRNVGAVIVDQNRHLVSIGYNGSPPGQPHCTGAGCASPIHGCTKAVHAERNALDRLEWDYSKKSLTMYVTESPCPACATSIKASGIFGSVFFLHPYRLSEGRDILMAAEIGLYRMTPAGHIIDCVTEELVEID